jgi:hypothetical protein
MHTLARRRTGRSITPALVFAALALAGLVVLAARELARVRRRARRRALLAVPEQAPTADAPELSAVAYADEDALEELRERPRPVSAEEAGDILGLPPDALASLNIPVTRAPDGRVVYDSWEIVHWLDVRQTDPAGFEARMGGH